MPASIIYRRTQRSNIWAAFAGAILLHLAAIAVATQQPTDAPAPPPSDDAIEITAENAEPVPPEPPEDAPQPEPANVAAPEESIVPEENPTPRPVREPEKRTAQRLVRPTAPSIAQRSASSSALKVSALNAPRPEYPYEARRQRLTGSGIAVLTIDPMSGNVLDVAMLRSTGSSVLDSATISGFRRWRFKPGTTSCVQTPITFTLTGASY